MGILETEIIVGTYESFLIGCCMEKKDSSEEEYELIQTFQKNAHTGAVRCVLGINRFVISGGSDELCKIFDLVSRKECGQLEHHDGTITCLAGYDKTHLLSASDDNSLAITGVWHWTVEKTLYKHQAGITAMAMHPSGKLAFTAAKDKKLITWNLVQARPAFITYIKGIAEFIIVSPDGQRYCVGIHRRVDIYSLENAGIEYTIELKSRPNGLVFLGNDAVAVACESPKIQIHSLSDKTLIKEFDAHDVRVRCIATIPEDKPKPETKGKTKDKVQATDTTLEETAQDATLEETATKPDTSESESKPEPVPTKGEGFVVVTASSSDFMVKLWRVHLDTNSEVRCIGSLNTTCRVTCLTTWNPSMRGRKNLDKKKRKKVSVDTTPETELPVKKKKTTKVSFNEVEIEKVVAEKEIRIPAPQLIVIEQEENDRNEKRLTLKEKKKLSWQTKEAEKAKGDESKMADDSVEDSATKPKKKKNFFSETAIAES